eukprot:TRINITY_DN14960_c0_g1_i1.p1 TRINITY_DN14960_c0_g1~~TRINITY_DN14960_c0_g1_i1.p1  ORF type:complete len:557 (-),score=139.34 TRINITY_DN14960_c0_g1_i1:152-1822(-)
MELRIQGSAASRVPKTRCDGDRKMRRTASLRPLFVTAAVAAVAWQVLEASLSFTNVIGPAAVEGRRRPLRSQSHVQLAAVATEVAPLLGKYKALTKIRLREQPDVKAEPTGGIVEINEVLDVTDAVPAGPGGMGYLYIGSRKGWIFDKGVAGAWVGKSIVQRIGEEAPAPSSPLPPTQPTAATAAPPAPAPAPAAAVEAEPVGVAVSMGSARLESLRLPSTMLGAGFDVVRMEVRGASQPLTFLLGSAFPKNCVNSLGQQKLGQTAPQSYSGGWASSAMAASEKVDLEDVTFLGTGANVGSIRELEVLDFPQAILAQQLGVEVHGILGQPFFQEREMDLDRDSQKIHLLEPGSASAEGFSTTVKHLPGLALASGNIGIVAKGNSLESGEEASFLGIVDTSAAFTTINWEAAKLLGYSGKDDPDLARATKVLGASSTGQAEEMPVVLMKLSLCGMPKAVKTTMKSVSREDFDARGGNGWYIKDLKAGDNCIDFGKVNVMIGDALGFAILNDSKVGPHAGAAAIIGQDLLFQTKRMVMNMKDSDLWLEAGEIKDDEEI